MLSFTPEVREALHWFALTHQLVASGGGTVQWMRTGLPAAGGVGDQDARLLETLEVLRGIQERLTQEAIERRRQHVRIEQWRRTRTPRTRHGEP